MKVLKKIIIITAIFFNIAKSCPTSLGFSLLAQNKISCEDVQDLNFNYLDFKS